MNVESLREYCLSLPLATEDFPFDETTLVFRVVGKILQCSTLNALMLFRLSAIPTMLCNFARSIPKYRGRGT